jgi:hypothetical protein
MRIGPPARRVGAMRTGGRTHEATHHYAETWCKSGQIGHVGLIGRVRVRYLRVGSGRPL